MTQHEFDRMKRETEIKGTGHSFPLLDTDEQKENASAEKRHEDDLAVLNFSYTNIFTFSQILGGKIVYTYEIANSTDFTEDRLLFMEKNMSMIHMFAFRDNGKKYRIYSQMIGTVDKIYYKT